MTAKAPIKTRSDCKIDKGKIIKQRAAGMSLQAIANEAGVSKQAISVHLRNLLPDKYTEQYKTNRADILSHVQYRLLNSIEDEEIKKTPVGSRILGACQLYDKERTERGLTNSISAVVHGDIEALRKCNTDQYQDVIDIDSDD